MNTPYYCFLPSSPPVVLQYACAPPPTNPWESHGPPPVFPLASAMKMLALTTVQLQAYLGIRKGRSHILYPVTAAAPFPLCISHFRNYCPRIP